MGNGELPAPQVARKWSPQFRFCEESIRRHLGARPTDMRRKPNIGGKLLIARLCVRDGRRFGLVYNRALKSLHKRLVPASATGPMRVGSVNKPDAVQRLEKPEIGGSATCIVETSLIPRYIPPQT